MVIKKIKAYGEKQRQRIDLNNGDGFQPDQEVVIVDAEIYELLQQELKVLQDKLIAKDKELELLHSQEDNLKQIIEDVTAPIYERHKKELESKDNEIKRLNDRLTALENHCTKYNLDMQGFNAIDILIMRKHKKLIQDFNSTISIFKTDRQVGNSDVPVIPGEK